MVLLPDDRLTALFAAIFPGQYMCHAWWIKRQSLQRPCSWI